MDTETGEALMTLLYVELCCGRIFGKMDHAVLQVPRGAPGVCVCVGGCFGGGGICCISL